MLSRTQQITELLTRNELSIQRGDDSFMGLALVSIMPCDMIANVSPRLDPLCDSLVPIMPSGQARTQGGRQDGIV